MTINTAAQCGASTVTGVRAMLDQDAIALLSPLGYSPAGELFSVSASEVAEAVAVAINADKLIFP